MRKTGGALLIASGLLVSGCGQSIKDLDVPGDFQQLIRDVSVGGQPSFSGKTCFSKPLEERESHRYRAEFTVPGSLAKVSDQLRGSAVGHGWQPHRTRNGEFVLIRSLNKREVVLSAAADGQNTKVSAFTEHNCGGDVPRDPLLNLVLGDNADPDPAPRQRQLLASAYDTVHQLGVAVSAELDPGKADPARMPSLPPIPDDYPQTDLKGCDADAATGAQGAQWVSSGLVAGFFTDTTDFKVVEDRIQAVAGKRWKATGRKDNVAKRVSYELEREVGGVRAALVVELKQTEDHRGRPGVNVQGGIVTGCVPPTVG
ncbi:hypothetical protein [Kibdelosporangium phytohabitans]|uniref:Uncharacterized protein n=1 Tax=Kibdelosporangium phytohabitans TaxID=860235 RepID=A0A0N9I379_9PSEU|nr:hypothetical protein [Kibdelosporangium phytohabitans]ALG08957.1 hypothetical protein AOZ06_20395 [Kibdelosporangium phytohabitans]MBE1469871.1 hypothetical protein [Kibdelosporangium phytohabitans]